MKTFSRYVLAEILAAASVSFLVLNALAIMGIAYQLHSRFPELLSPGFLLFIPFLLPEVFFFTVPMALLAGVTATASRLSADGEFDAFALAGKSVRSLLPGLLACSVFIGAGYFLLAAYVVPRAHYTRKTYVTRFTLDLGTVLDLLQDGRVQIKGYHFYFERREGRTIHNIILAENKDKGFLIRAGRAECTFKPERRELDLVLHNGSHVGFSRKKREIVHQTTFDLSRVRLNLQRALLSPHRKARDLPFGSLISALKGMRTAEPKFGRHRMELAQRKGRYKVELWHRVASGFSIPVIILLGLALGIAFQKRGLAESITASIVIAAAVYWPLHSFAAKTLAAGALPTWCAMQAPNAALLACAAVFALIGRKVRT
jgi:lipopolysaccharide export system permease protein